MPERVRRVSSSSASRAAAGTGEVTRRSTARSLRRARRPARSAAEPSRPVLPFFSSSSSAVIGGAAGGGMTGPGCRPAQRPGQCRPPGHRGAGPGEGPAPRVAAGRRGIPPRGLRGRPEVGNALRPPDFISASISSLVTDFSGRWVLGIGRGRSGPLRSIAARRRRGGCGDLGQGSIRSPCRLAPCRLSAGLSDRAGGVRPNEGDGGPTLGVIGRVPGGRHVIVAFQGLEAAPARNPARRAHGRRLTGSGLGRGPWRGLGGPARPGAGAAMSGVGRKRAAGGPSSGKAAGPRQGADAGPERAGAPVGGGGRRGGGGGRGRRRASRAEGDEPGINRWEAAAALDDARSARRPLAARQGRHPRAPDSVRPAPPAWLAGRPACGTASLAATMPPPGRCRGDGGAGPLVRRSDGSSTPRRPLTDPSTP